jgi:hypothetical protein
MNGMNASTSINFNFHIHTHTLSMIAFVSRSSMSSTSMISGFSTRTLTVIMEGEDGGEAAAVVGDDLDFAAVTTLALDDFAGRLLECEVIVSAEASSAGVVEGAMPLVKKFATFIK